MHQQQFGDSPAITLAASPRPSPSLFANNTPPGSNYLKAESQSSANVASRPARTIRSAVGYLSPDYTSIAPNSPNTTTLKVASLVNPTNGIAYQPTTGNTALGLKSPGTGSTNPNPPSSQSAAANPLNWVPSIPQTNAGYNIVGYTTMDLSSCYADKTAGSDLINFLNEFLSNSAYSAIINANGFVPVINSAAARYVTAIKNDFLGNKSHYNLNIDNPLVCASTNKKHMGFAGR